MLSSWSWSFLSIVAVNAASGSLSNPTFTVQFQSTSGIAGYDLLLANDLVFPFDYASKGVEDHLVLYRPGEGILFVVAPNAPSASELTYTRVYSSTPPPQGLPGLDLHDIGDRVFAFDYDHRGKADHLVAYRPGAGIITIVRPNGDGWEAVYNSSSGIGGYDLRSPLDLGFAFDSSQTGAMDGLVFYRPGGGAAIVLTHTSPGIFVPAYFVSGGGLGDAYDLLQSVDRVFAFDFEGSGRKDHLVAYRPGTGLLRILACQRYSNGTTGFEMRFQAAEGAGVGGFALNDGADQAMAYDFVGSGKEDHLVLYRPGSGLVSILERSASAFLPVYQQLAPNAEGFGSFQGTQLGDARAKVMAFDFRGNRTANGLLVYVPGARTAAVLSLDLQKSGGNADPGAAADGNAATSAKSKPAWVVGCLSAIAILLIGQA